MKKLIIITLLAVTALASTALAVEDNPCDEVYNLAETIMGARQVGVSAKGMINVCDNQGNKEVKELCILLVKDSYTEPAYGSTEYQTKATKAFANKWYLGCLK